MKKKSRILNKFILCTTVKEVTNLSKDLNILYSKYLRLASLASRGEGVGVGAG